MTKSAVILTFLSYQKKDMKDELKNAKFDELPRILMISEGIYYSLVTIIYSMTYPTICILISS